MDWLKGIIYFIGLKIWSKNLSIIKKIPFSCTKFVFVLYFQKMSASDAIVINVMRTSSTIAGQLRNMEININWNCITIYNASNVDTSCISFLLKTKYEQIMTKPKILNIHIVLFLLKMKQDKKGSDTHHDRGF